MKCFLVIYWNVYEPYLFVVGLCLSVDEGYSGFELELWWIGRVMMNEDVEAGVGFMVDFVTTWFVGVDGLK